MWAPRSTSTPDDVQVSGMLAFTESLLATVRGDGANGIAALEHAAELAERIGEGNALWFGFGVSNVAIWRMVVALEAGDHAEAATIGAGVQPDAIPSPQRRAAYWADYGRALSRVRGQRPAAVAALRRAEHISPASWPGRLPASTREAGGTGSS